MEINNATVEIDNIRAQLVAKFQKISEERLVDIKQFASQVLENPLKAAHECDTLLSSVAEMDVAKSIVHMLKSKLSIDHIEGTLTHLVMVDITNPNPNPSALCSMMSQQLSKARVEIINAYLLDENIQQG